MGGEAAMGEREGFGLLVAMFEARGEDAVGRCGFRPSGWAH